MRRIAPPIAELVFLLACCVSPPIAVAAQDVLNIDLAPLIEKEAQHRNHFAVDVPDRFSSATHGVWTTTGAVREWTYSVRIPSAVSMSFHGWPVELPASARLTVAGGSASSTYLAPDISGASLWSRPLLGDTLTLTLSVNAADVPKVRLEVLSLQAGYRGLSHDVPDHPSYRRLKPATAAASQSCEQNFACNSTDANGGPAKATVAVLIGNIGQCTGTLLNEARGDGKAYILTARHCQNGAIGGGLPNAAAAITIYWDAVSPCGQTLGSLYTGATTAQSGASTVVEQQDAWLVELNQAPRIPDPYYAGWDVSGTAFTGGYSIHHAMGRDKQFVAWHGQSILQRISGSILGAPYDSDFWGLVNSFGNVGAGASGGALFDPVNRVVGSASLAYLVDGEGSDGVCPVAAPQAPTAATITAQYTALSAVWNSTADASSTTGSKTLRSVLDPDGSGRSTLDGFGLLPMQLLVNTSSEGSDRFVTLSWDVTWAQSCTATGGRAGDGWAGTRPTRGSAQVTEATGGAAQYVLSCVSGDRRGNATANVNWIFIAPLISLRGPSRPVMLGSQFELRWDANVDPCMASDGLAGDGWAGVKSQPGQQTLVATRLGATTYSISCGTGARIAATQVTVQVVAPSVTLHADATRLRNGATFNLWWQSDADGTGACSGSGGAPGWAENTGNVQPSGSTQSTYGGAGTFTYTMTCSGGGLSASSSVTVEFVLEPVSSSLTAVVAQQEIYEQGNVPANRAPNLLWTSNMGFCNLASIGPVGNRSVDLDGQYPAGTAAAVEFIAGTYEYQLNCPTIPIARTSIEWVTAHPKITIEEITQHTSTWVGGYSYQLAWGSNTLPCTASGGAPGDGWAGFKDNAAQAAQTVTAPMVPGTYTYSLRCGSGTSIGTQDFVVTVPSPAVTLVANSSRLSVVQYATLSWNSTVYPCTANADGAGVSWGSSNMFYAGSSIDRQTIPGTYTYTIRCGSGAQTASASTQLTFRAGDPTVLTANASNVPVNTPVILSWESGSNNCNAIGGVEGDGWAGAKPTSGSMTVTSVTAQAVGYAINCDAGGQSIVVTYTGGVSSDSPSVTRPAATLSASRASQTVGQSIALTWDSRNAAACYATGGSSGDGWAGSTALSGTMNVTSSSAGSATYSITCTGATPAATAQTTVTFASASGTSGEIGGSGSSGGGGGGGALDICSALLMLLMTLMVGSQPGVRPLAHLRRQHPRQPWTP
jgi:hypothetical protein